MQYCAPKITWKNASRRNRPPQPLQSGLGLLFRSIAAVGGEQLRGNGGYQFHNLGLIRTI